MERNHYRVLAVAPDATVEEIERSFRQLARRNHPDVNGGDGAAEERMKELNVARATLTDAAERAAFDERLRHEQRAKSAPAAPIVPRPVAPRSPEERPFTTPGGASTSARPASPTNVSAQRPFAPTNVSGAHRPFAGSTKAPPVSWWKTRDVPPPPAAIEIGRFSSAGRLFWISLAALAGLAVVVLLIWLRQAIDVGP